MKTEKISDVLQGMDVNTEDAIVTLSDKIWEIGSIDEIRQQVSDVTFTFHVVTNVIGNCQGDGSMSTCRISCRLVTLHIFCDV